MITQVQELFDLQAGKKAKEEGALRVAEHNDPFIQTMGSFAINMAQFKGSVTSDDLREYAAKHGIAPKHQNAWGSIFRGKHWRSVGFTRSAYIGNHARTIRIWEYVP